VWLFAFSAARSLWLTIALALILGGTLGNLYDRIGLHGCRDTQGANIAAVRDFLLFTFGDFHWPVFNFADVFLVSGASMLVVHSLFPVQSETAGTQAADVAAPAKTAQAASTSAPAVASLPSPPTR
jgi:signal peptidase II